MNKLSDNEIIKSFESLLDRIRAYECNNSSIGKGLIEDTINLINRKDAEIEQLNIELKAMRGAANSYKAEVERLQKPTETSGFKNEKGKVVFYTNMLNGYRHEYSDLDEVVKELNLMLQSCYNCDEVVSHYKGNLQTAKSEAIKEFAERLKVEFKPEQNYDNIANFTIKLFTNTIDNLVKEMVGDVDA